MKKTTFSRKMIFSVLAILISLMALLVIQKTNALSLDENSDTSSIPIPPTPDIESLNYSERLILAPPQREISRIINLAKDLPNKDIFVYIILRKDGTYEEYHLSATSLWDKDNLMNVGKNDKIITGYPLQPILSTPILEAPPKDTPSDISSPPNEPYPPPMNKALDTPIIQPYP